jgi:hypothetical protein
MLTASMSDTPGTGESKLRDVVGQIRQLRELDLANIAKLKVRLRASLSVATHM